MCLCVREGGAAGVCVCVCVCEGGAAGVCVCVRGGHRMLQLYVTGGGDVWRGGKVCVGGVQQVLLQVFMGWAFCVCGGGGEQELWQAYACACGGAGGVEVCMCAPICLCD